MKTWYHRERNRDLQPHEAKAWQAACCEWRGRNVPVSAKTVIGVKRFGRYIIQKDRDLLWALYMKHLLLRSERWVKEK